MTKAEETQAARIVAAAHEWLATHPTVIGLEVARIADADPSECYRVMAFEATLEPCGWRAASTEFQARSPV